MVYKQQLYISPATLTDLKVIVKYVNMDLPIRIMTLDDFNVVDNELNIGFALVSDCTVAIYSQGYKVKTLNITTEYYEDKHIVLTPTSDYIKSSDGTNDYYVKDTYSRQFENDLLGIVQTKADTADIPTATSDLTNDSGYITGITSSDVTTALGYTSSDTTLSNVTSIDANSAVQTALDGKVSKSGDTMTGSLVNTSDFEGSKYWMKVNGVNKGTNPTSTQYAAWEMVDNKGKDGGTWQAKRISTIEYSLDNSGTAKMMIGPYQNTANSSNAAYLTLSITSSGATSCTFPNTTCCDGRWVKWNVANFADQINLANSSNTSWSKSVSSYLPDDGRDYEILVSGNVVTGNASGNYATLEISSDICDLVKVCRAQTRTAATAQASGTVWLPVGSGRTIAVRRASSWVGEFTIDLRGYRRIGTNS